MYMEEWMEKRRNRNGGSSAGKVRVYTYFSEHTYTLLNEKSRRDCVVSKSV